MGQHPFNYGQTKNIYFFSAADLGQLGIKHIYTVGKRQAENDIDLSDIDFNPEGGGVRNGWSIYYGRKKNPSLQELIDSASYMNGSIYEFGEDGKINRAGSEGHGALCMEDYNHQQAYAYAIQSCRYDVVSTVRKIFYYPNGLVKFSVCCQTDSSAFPENDEDTSIVNLPDRRGDFRDTTWYIYNSKWLATGTRDSAGFKPFFKSQFALTDEYHQSYINMTRFEAYIDKKIGYRPALVLFEIYRNAVFVFRYNEKIKKYQECPEISLE